MANIKVTFGSISRRLSISSNTTWSEIETQFRNLFNIPKEIQIIVSYTDEEGDIITLSSDLEFQEVLSNSSNNNNNTIKFVLTTTNTNNNVLDRERSIDTVVDEETSNLINGVSAIQIEDSSNNNNEHKSNSNYKHVTITDEVDDPLFSQEQYSSQETPGETSKNATESINNDNVQGKNHSTKRNQENQENSDDDGPEIIVIITRNPWLHRRRQRFGECNPYYRCFGGRSHHNSRCDRTASSRGYGCGRYYRRNQQISSEVVAEKLNILHSMGFVNDNLEELIKKYNGNLELIIEVLLFNQQNEQNNERKEVTNDEKDQPMEVEEEYIPYVV
ncbi:hypothetical protein C1645_780299 [Glomus cerebriforme]|uniref:PB1 domain-containing protein n=1 Tax=Glomus cerebriforme TaxID=658196 RepID=A0A397SKI8_9GLOM|nr:hypothetical protein C1645_780299 [Glomus cerebriforme]